MDIIQDGLGPHEKNIIMSSGSITRSWAKKLKQAFRAYVQEWINEEWKLGPDLGAHGKMEAESIEPREKAVNSSPTTYGLSAKLS